MASFKSIVPVLAVLGRAVAQSSCSVDATTTIQNQGDATGLASCTTFSGSIALATGTTGQIQLDGIQHITGDLYADNVTQLTQLSASNLEAIDGAFHLSAITILTGLNFPRLTTVNKIDWSHLTNLQSLQFTTAVQMAQSVSIQDTDLNTLEGINLQTVDTMIIANNLNLDDITMQLGNITTLLSLDSNGRNVSANFPNLISAKDLNIANVSSFSAPSLATVNGTLVYGANFASSFAAPNLTSITQNLAIIGNPSLTNTSFPMLTTLGGGLVVANNTKLSDISGFPELKTVGGDISFFGAFTGAELPALSSVRGAANVKSTEDISSTCTTINKLKSSGVIQGVVNCNSSDATATSIGGSGNTTSSGGAHKSSGAASAIYISGATGVLGVLAALFGML